MNFNLPHSWQLSPSEAVRLQKELQTGIVLQDIAADVRYVAGVDVGIDRQRGLGRAAVVVLDRDGLRLVDSAVAEIPLTFPYVPGLLSFRELPVILKALEQLQTTPDVFLCDGQGIAHPRRFGIACHLGLVTGVAALGVAKTRLCGTHEEVPAGKGSWVPLVDKNEVIGAVLRTRTAVKPVFVSPGYGICLETAIEVVMSCVTRYRLPETTRMAHNLSLFQKK